MLAAFEDARRSGAAVIVGPLVRDDLKTVAQMCHRASVDARAQPGRGRRTGPRRTLYTFSLAVESDARLIARRMRDDAAQYVAIVGRVDTPLMKRFAGAFATEWLQGGGTLPRSVSASIRRRKR